MSEVSLPHEDAVTDFVDRVRSAELDDVERLVLFGSVARARHTSNSDIDILAVLASGTDERALEERLRDLAYDTMLEYGTAVSVHAVTEDTLDERGNHPFFSTVLDHGRAIYG